MIILIYCKMTKTRVRVICLWPLVTSFYSHSTPLCSHLLYFIYWQLTLLSGLISVSLFHYLSLFHTKICLIFRGFLLAWTKHNIIGQTKQRNMYTFCLRSFWEERKGWKSGSDLNGTMIMDIKWKNDHIFLMLWKRFTEIRFICEGIF